MQKTSRDQTRVLQPYISRTQWTKNTYRWNPKLVKIWITHSTFPSESNSSSLRHAPFFLYVLGPWSRKRCDEIWRAKINYIPLTLTHSLGAVWGKKKTRSLTCNYGVACSPPWACSQLCCAFMGILGFSCGRRVAIKTVSKLWVAKALRQTRLRGTSPCRLWEKHRKGKTHLITLDR